MIIEQIFCERIKNAKISSKKKKTQHTLSSELNLLLAIGVIQLITIDKMAKKQFKQQAIRAARSGAALDV